MKCKYSVGHCHVYDGEEGAIDSHCPNCSRSSGNKSFKEQFESFYDWGMKIYRDPSIEDKRYYRGFAHGIKTVLAMLGDDYDVFESMPERVEVK